MTEETLNSCLLLAGRIGLASVFLVSGVHKGVWYQKAVEEFREAKGSLARVLCLVAS